ncbi:hypothetical protein PC129_g18123 [Phytophthora cactorum]|nr:hypothetical protein Pcac1_g11172 [Phytophthora cactorum]KAG2804956.1 hypothetical protein PC112_g18488 [Phytophthora cactorum]KAG2805458.1 hypothetical protein PC111_g17803 [Phytophthora cactorum]KAG2841861.1 hypothetical protein PC113_g18940 [Phytophthora cactorum]KAG2885129.1 hypothetical protein PC114_g19832 [Phytophthora cactorum]
MKAQENAGKVMRTAALPRMQKRKASAETNEDGVTTPDKQTKRFKAAVLHMTREKAAVGRALKERKWEMERVEREEERELRLELARMEHDRLKRIIQALVGSRGDQRNGDDAVNRDNAAA